jgi:hypothetical protein
MGRHKPPFEALGRAIWARSRKYALAQVANAVKYGELPRPETLPCAYCGGPASIYEHRSYHRHIDVVPACDSCNHKQPPAELDPRIVLDHIEGRKSFYVEVVFPAAQAEESPVTLMPAMG